MSTRAGTPRARASGGARPRLERLRSRAVAARAAPRDWPLRTKLVVALLVPGLLAVALGALRVADEAARARVPVYTVALGTASGTIEGRSPSGGTVTRRVPPDPETLREVARRTGGEAFAIDDAQELEQVFARLGSRVATEEQEREVSSWFAGGALLLLVGGVATSLRWFGRPL